MKTLAHIKGQDNMLQEAAKMLAAGRLVAFPTETVYGLGADASNETAVSRIYTAKGRPSTHPLIVHIAGIEQASQWTQTVHQAAFNLMQAFWPGPLTLILPSATGVSPVLTGGQPSIGLRCPRHPIAQALLLNFKNGQGGIAAPSANRFGRISPTTAEHVYEEFAPDPKKFGIDLILDGGCSEVGIESTILDCSKLHEGKWAQLLRPGQINVDELYHVLGYRPEYITHSNTRASGTLPAHYAPTTACALVSLKWIKQHLPTFSPHKKIALLHYSPVETSGLIQSYRMPIDPNSYAQKLYANLRLADKQNADWILIEATPDHLTWQGIHDRLVRACYAYVEAFKKNNF